MELTRQKAPVSIKLLPDEPEYKIIEDITGVQPGDVFVQTNGNKYPVQEITDDDHCLVLIDSNTYRIDDDAFDHALRPAPARIPESPRTVGGQVRRPVHRVEKRSGALRSCRYASPMGVG